MTFKLSVVLLFFILLKSGYYCDDDNEGKPSEEEIEAEELIAAELISQWDGQILEAWLERNEIIWAGMENYRLEEYKIPMDEAYDSFNVIVEQNADEFRSQFIYWPFYKNETISRILRIIIICDPTYVGKTAEEYVALTDKLTNHQASAILCTSKEDTECKSDAFEINELMKVTEDAQLLTDLWLEPRIKLGLNELKEDFSMLSQLWDTAAKEQNYENAVDLRLEVYRLADELYDNSMAKHYTQVWKDVKKFYHKLHAVCLDLLQKYYPDKCVPQGGLMPAMFVGVFGQEWQHWPHIFNLFNKTEGLQVTDISATMESMQNERNQKDYAILANELMVSMGLPSLPDDFIENSFFVGDENKSCEGTHTMDFMDGRVRVGICAELNILDIQTIYSLAADAQNILLYSTQEPIAFRQQTTLAWEDALSYFMITNFNSPTYLERINLVTQCEETEETMKYYMMQLALEFYPLLAHAVVLESYRDDLFMGEFSIEEANCEFYYRVAEIQGLMPAVQMDENGFHPAIKHTYAQDSTYMNYMYQPIFGFQLHEYLCELCNQCSNGEYLHQCDLTGCQEAGEVINKLMSFGASVSWQTAFKEVFQTDDAKMSGKAMNRFFKPIEEALDSYIEDQGLQVGWEVDEEVICKKKTCESGGD